MLTGPLVDQTALHGVLIKIRDLGLPLLSLTRTETGRVHTNVLEIGSPKSRTLSVLILTDQSRYDTTTSYKER